ncbi:MAG: hypothetical protein ACI80K_002780 [Paracoccaceae bacterium]|jgi:hypothetical protein
MTSPLGLIQRIARGAVPLALAAGLLAAGCSSSSSDPVPTVISPIANALIDAGDELYLRYGEPIVVNLNADAADFKLPKVGDSLGAGATVEAGEENFTVIITLGTSPVLRTRGVYDSALNMDPNAPSGIDMEGNVTADSIESAADGTDVSFVGSVEINIQPVTFTVTAAETVEARRSAVGDLDGDGDLDYLQRIGDVGSITDRFFLNNGSGVFTDSGLTLGLDTFAAGDMDRDGDQDLVVVTGAVVETWDGFNNGTFMATGQTDDLVTNHVVAAFADDDGDGDIDMFSSDTSSVRILENDGFGGLTEVDSVTFASTGAIALSDLDRDGDLDMLLGSTSGATNLSWSAYDSSTGYGVVQTSLSVMNVINDLQLFDRDEDGQVDLYGVDAATGNRFLNRGLGDGTFAAGGPSSFVGLSSMMLIDADRDGDVDIYGAFGNGSGPAATADQIMIFN